MYTRKEYLAKQCTHEEYYGQFVTDSIKSAVLRHFEKSVLEAAYKEDSNFNSKYGPTRLERWDMISGSVAKASAFKEAGDYQTLCGQVCVLKEAARQIVVGLGIERITRS